MAGTLGAAAAVVAGYLLLAGTDLPGLRRQPDRRGEFWATVALLIVGLAVTLLLTLGFTPPSIWLVVQALFRPAGSIFFMPAGA